MHLLAGWPQSSALPYAERQHNAVSGRYRGRLELCRDAEALEVEAGSPVRGGALVSGVVEADRGDIAKGVEGEHSVDGVELEAVGCRRGVRRPACGRRVRQLEARRGRLVAKVLGDIELAAVADDEADLTEVVVDHTVGAGVVEDLESARDIEGDGHAAGAVEEVLLLPVEQRPAIRGRVGALVDAVGRAAIPDLGPLRA